MVRLDHAIVGLEQILERPRRQPTWRWLVRQRVAAVNEALAGEITHAADAWLASRQGALVRERDSLLRKFDRFSTRVVDSADPEAVRFELKRLVSDLRRHRQRLNDLLYDTVSLELGGSE